MEIIFEVLFAIFWFLLQFVYEMLLQSIFEVLAEVGLRSLSEPFRSSEPVNPILAGIGYFLYGAIAGGLSLFIPKMLTVPEWLRIVNLIVAPVACGFIMAKVGQFREHRGDRPIRIDTFMFGYLFALAMAVVRFIWR